MRLYQIFAILSILFLTTGCGNLSPRLENKIDNQNGKIDRIESNQNAIRFAIERRNENSGVQILQGEGSFLLILGIVAILSVTFYFYKVSVKNEKIANLLIEQIKSHNDEELEENVLKAALYTDVEKEIYYKIKKPNN